MRRGPLLFIAVALPLFLALSSWLRAGTGVAGATPFHRDPHAISSSSEASFAVRSGFSAAGAALLGRDLLSVSSISDAGLASQLAGGILGTIALESSGDLQNMTASIRGANLPPQFRLVASNIAGLTQELHDVLTQLKETISEIDRSNALLDARATREGLVKAQTFVQRGQQIVDDLTAATSRLVNSAALSSRLLPGVAAELEQARRHLAALERTAAAVSESSIPTELDLRPGQLSVFVGQNLPVSGALTVDGKGLENKNIDFLLDGEIIGSTTTTTNGNFETRVQMPLRYLPEVHLVARYVPDPAEILDYYGASAQVIISLSYYTTTLTFDAPASVDSGRTITLKISTAPVMANPAGHYVTIILAGWFLGMGQCNGTCEMTVKVPDGAPLGAQSLEVFASPSDLYSGAESAAIVSIVQSPVLLQLDAPQFVVVPGGLSATGSVSSGFGNEDTGSIVLSVGNLSQSVPLTNGKFEVNFELPLSFSLGGQQTLEVSFQPDSPWLAPTQQTRKILVANGLNVGLLLLLLGLAGTAITAKRRAASASQEAPFNVTEMVTGATFREELGFRMPVQPRTQVVESYWRVVRVLEQVLGIVHSKSSTLREFGRVVERRNKVAAAPLGRLTAIAEESLYSPRRPSTSQAEEADQQVEEVKRSLDDA